MPKTIYWDIQDFKNIPKDDQWLSKSEQEIQASMRFAKRRSEWRLGRWVTKNALHKYLAIPFSKMEVLPQKNGAPKIFINNKEHKLALSISHRERKAICAFSDQLNSVGCDLEFIEPRSDIFINDYFTADELYLMQQAEQKDIMANLIWAAKESVTKVLQLGLNLDTKDVNVHTISFSAANEWADLNISLKNETAFYGAWKKMNNYVITIAAKSPFIRPSRI